MGRISGWIGSAKGLRRTRNVFAAFYLQTQTRRRTKQTAFVSPNTINRITAKTKTDRSVGLCFWWEWVDSNHLSRKTTDLQSAPALQLRRTPTSLVRAAGIEPAFQAWKACILALELCSQQIQSPLIISYFLPNASIYSICQIYFDSISYSSISTVSIYLRETDSNFTG